MILKRNIKIWLFYLKENGYSIFLIENLSNMFGEWDMLSFGTLLAIRCQRIRLKVERSLSRPPKV